MDEKEAEARPVMGTIFLVINKFMQLLLKTGVHYCYKLQSLTIMYIPA